MKRIRISSSIANFSEKLRKRYSDYSDFQWFSLKPTLFFGMYHIFDYLRLFTTLGPKTVFWCGSDIKEIFWWPWFLKVRHVCENEVEQAELRRYGIHAEIHPMIFDDPSKYTTTYKQAKEPKVWMTFHLGREEEYGVERFFDLCNKAGVEGTAFFGGLTPEQFDDFTASYQGCVRLNVFDGFSENVAKALLRGQYPISVIPYPLIDEGWSDGAIIHKLKALKNKKKPNPYSEEWRKILSNRVEA